MRSELSKHAEAFGYELSEHADAIIRALQRNNGNCPCRKDLVPCPCPGHHEDILKGSKCHCGLFVKRSVDGEVS